MAWIGQNGADTGLHCGRIGITQLLITSREPGFEHVQGEHIPEAEGAIALGEGGTRSGRIALLALAGFADGDPFVIGLQRGVAPGDPITFRGALVVFSTALPTVVNGFMVVPYGDQRRSGTQGLQARIRVVLGVAQAVVVETDDLAVGQEATAAGGVFGGSIAAGAIFIDIVANLKPGVIRVGAVDARCPGVGIELLGRWEVSAGEYSQSHRIAAHWQSLGLPHHRNRIASTEAVVIGGVSVEAISLHLYRPITVSTGTEQAAIHDRTGLKAGATRYFPTHVNRLGSPLCSPLGSLLGWRNPGPEDHRIGVGITRGHAMGKTDRGSGHSTAE